MEHLVKNDTHAPNIAAVAELLPTEHFWGCIEWGAKAGQLLSLSRFINHSTETKVTEFSNSLLQKYVCRLDITMDDFLLEQLLVAADEMAHENEGLSLADSSILAIFIEVILQVAVFAIFQDDVEVLSAAEAVVHLDDEGRGQRLESGDLAFDLFFNVIGKFVDIYTFNGNLDPIFALSVEDATAGSMAERTRFQYAIVGYLFHHSITHVYNTASEKNPDFPYSRTGQKLRFFYAKDQKFILFVIQMVSSLEDLQLLYQNSFFWHSFTLILTSILYLLYYYNYHAPHFLFTGQYDISKKNMRKPPPPYPNGWYNVAKAHELKPGQVKPVDVNGHNIVVYRGTDGVVYALQAYCLHMGAHLGVGGEVVNEKCIQCPFHGWLYDGRTGHCVDHDGKPLQLKSIEYGQDIGKNEGKFEWKERKAEKATLRKYPVCELNGYIYIWIHAMVQFYQNPGYPLIDMSNFIKHLSYRGQIQHRVRCHIQDIPANGADSVHFKYVHNTIFSWLKSLYFRWQAKWKTADDPDIKSLFEHERKEIRQFKQKIYKEIVEPYPKKEILSIANLQNWVHIPLLGEYFMLSGTIIQVGMGVVYIFLKHKFFQYVVHHYVRPEGRNYQIVLHDCYISNMVPYFISSKIIETEGWQVTSDMIVWDAKSFTKRTYLNESKNDAIMKQWFKWSQQFYQGCRYEEESKKNSW